MAHARRCNQCGFHEDVPPSVHEAAVKRRWQTLQPSDPFEVSELHFCSLQCLLTWTERRVAQGEPPTASELLNRGR